MKVNKTTEATNLLLSFCYINLLILTKHTKNKHANIHYSKYYE